MSQFSARVAIIGGGLSGLTAAMLLEQQGVRDVVLFEARHTLGGRILSVDAGGSVVDAREPALDRFDLGPSWFWPGLQPQLDRLVDELGLRRFAQFEDGDLLVERTPREAPLRMKGYASSPPSMRLAGGTGALIAAIRARLDHTQLRTGQTVRRLCRVGSHVDLRSEDASGALTTWRVDQVLLALPPRLAEDRITFEPPLPSDLASRWRATPTWMAPHAKYVAVYDAPFWRDQGLSGSARSALGPMAEIHDVSMPGGHAALFGFVGVPARGRRDVPDGVLRAHCRAQLGRLFGERATTPVADALKDWAMDPLTATDADQDSGGQHGEAPPRCADSGPWQGCLTGIGSEWSRQFPGYLAGAVEAAAHGVQDCLASASSQPCGGIVLTVQRR
ncbi:MAG: amine oxidase [Burkholderiales bacterium RIFCSPLOWO2_12_FULL_64_99]|nr:MAG: amine oxidase [Burkholderiales bacterium RIFCSPHIGHO2_12_FULL_63_20]OGB62007.1 MAG: amine oxidase [Burkholderiales bacterium RIFCSPLOWO2_12_FULL_64_99]